MDLLKKKPVVKPHKKFVFQIKKQNEDQAAIIAELWPSSEEKEKDEDSSSNPESSANVESEKDEESEEKDVEKPVQVKFFDDREKGFDIESLRERLKQRNILKVLPKRDFEGVEKIKALEKEMKERKEKAPEKERKERKEKAPEKERKEKSPERKEKALEKKEIDEYSGIERIPSPQLPPLTKDSYYMNNREYFTRFINDSLFKNYKIEFEEEADKITCDTLQKSSKVGTLLLHQRVIRDYINIYTPYRGLLILHGLGSGKTASSIGIAEALKSEKKIIIMTPASLRTNYIEELKKYGDPIFKKNQYWEWMSKPEDFNMLSSVLSLSIEYIKKKRGAWLVNIKKKSNYPDLSSEDKKSLDEQLNEMIYMKYTFINYNGLRSSKLQELTNNFTKNLFDNAVVIIDEAHNLVSRIVNKIEKEKEIKSNKKGEKDELPRSMALKLYEYLMSAQNARVVLLSGTPIINYPNEVGIIYNMLRGYIKTWEIPVLVKTRQKITTETLQKSLLGEKILDYLEYSPSKKIIFVTRNPFGFKNKVKREGGYQGVSYEKQFISDDDFEQKIIQHLRRMDIEVNVGNIKIHNYKALPDRFDDFVLRFINPATKEINNIELFKRRIIGLTSYFRSAQEDLLPRYEKTEKYYHVLKIPMSNYQFTKYEDARKSERVLEKKRTGEFDKNGLYKEPSSTYRIFSRAYCNFVMPNRPMPKENQKISETQKIIEGSAKEPEPEPDIKETLEKESDDVIKLIADGSYQDRIISAINEIKDNASEYLTPEALEKYSPKFLRILENLQNEEYKGLHLLYSQFRTLEGIGLLAITLDYNGFTQFKLTRTSSGMWDVDLSEENKSKKRYALYTGTESAEEKEIIRNIYNGAWEYVPSNIVSKLRIVSDNNNYGEIIKLLMITSSGSEGINLKNTRYVHIMEPYWHPVRVEQVVGRARRICSHKDLPVELQTVEVFIYLMEFSKEQLKKEEATNIKKYDLSKRKPHVPLTSDEALYEISSIKEEINLQIITGIKEASIDCAIYSGKSIENLKCLSFNSDNKMGFSYTPSIEGEQSDVIKKINEETTEKKITWKAQKKNIKGVDYAIRKINDKTYEVYDMESYERVAKSGTGELVKVGMIDVRDGKPVFKKI